MISTPFLKEIAALLLTDGEYDLSKTCVVFPNKRARLYLSKYLGELTDKPVWAPRYMTINELMENLSGWIYADRLTLLFELFEVYKTTTGSNEGFEAFFTFAEPLLADFDEIDKYLADAGDLFSNLEGLKSLEGRFSYLSDEQVAAIRRFWSTFQPDQPSEGQKSFVTLWNVMPALYEGLKERLSVQGLAYEGMAYRAVVEKLEKQFSEVNFTYNKYLFIGFNALNRCEEKLFRHLKNLGKAQFYWDYDDWYTNTEIHEAGYFIRKNLINFPPAREINHDSLISLEKKISFLPVPSNTGQAQALPLIFEKLGLQSDMGHTALVLADENLLIPVMYAIPEPVKDLNVTLGYPVTGSAVFNLVDSIAELDKNRRKNRSRESSYYYKDVLSFLGNSLMKSRFQNDYEQIRKTVTEKSQVYLTADEIFSTPGVSVILPGEADPQHTCEYLLDFFEDLIRRFSESAADRVQQEILYQLFLFLTRLNDILDKHDFEPDRQTLFRILKRMLRTLHIPFNGEPLSGLQMLGILETRTLDFDNVIFLSMNEGVLPRSTTIPSFIPQSLRFGFGLPTPDHHDSIYAYYFYRLIQRASNVVLIYDSSTGGLKTGERSRFLHQLNYELPIPVEVMTPSFSIARLPNKAIVVEKKGDVAAALEIYNGLNPKLLSPSAINEYLNCPLQFYFHYIAGLPQPEEIAEEIDARLFGILLHKAMQLIYSRFGNLAVTRDKLSETLKTALDEEIDRAFADVLYGEKEIRADRKIEGFSLIVRKVISAYIRNILRADEESSPFTVMDLEKKVRIPFAVNPAGKELNLMIGGTIDRIDLIGGRIRIIDYKTGMVKNTFATVESLFSNGDKPRNDAVFQVLVYAMVYSRLFPEYAVMPSLCFVRESQAEHFSYHIKYGEKKLILQDYTEVKTEFEEGLLMHLNGLFNTDEPFVQTANRKICANCPYAVICGREDTV